MAPVTPASEVKKHPTNPTKIIDFFDGLVLLFSMGYFIRVKLERNIFIQILGWLVAPRYFRGLPPRWAARIQDAFSGTQRFVYPLTQALHTLKESHGHAPILAASRRHPAPTVARRSARPSACDIAITRLGYLCRSTQRGGQPRARGRASAPAARAGRFAARKSGG